MAVVPASQLANRRPPVATQSRLLNNEHGGDMEVGWRFVGGGGQQALIQQHPALVIRNLILIPSAGFVVSQETRILCAF